MLGYLKLLKLLPKPSDAIELIERIQRDNPDHLDSIPGLFEDIDWRPHLVGCIAVLLQNIEMRARFTVDMWKAFDRGSWVAPQLAVSLSYADSGFCDQAVERLQNGCLVVAREENSLSSLELHVLHGPGSTTTRSGKNAVSLVQILEDRFPEVVGRIDTDQLEPVLAEDYDNSGRITKAWNLRLRGLSLVD